MNTDAMTPNQRELHGVMVKHADYWTLDSGSQRRMFDMPTFPLLHHVVFFAPDMSIPVDDWNKKAMHHMKMCRRIAWHCVALHHSASHSITMTSKVIGHRIDSGNSSSPPSIFLDGECDQVQGLP